MERNFSLVLLLLPLLSCLTISVRGHASDLPAGIQRCAIKDNECVLNGVNFVLKNHAQSGIKELGLIPLDPLHVTKFTIGRNPHSPVSIDLSFTEVDLLGLSRARAKRLGGFSLDLSNPIEFVMEAPELAFKGPYSVDGKVLILPIVGKGRAEIVLKHCKIHSLITLRPISKGGHHTFAEVTDIKLQVDPSHVSYKLEGLFHGQKDLSENMHILINENWQEIFNELKPSISEAMGLIVKSVLNKTFGKTPLEELFIV
ncbi:protein takeout [Drosophila pseudoobscura]|uniref:Protein takeout n=1 Tax=Drosophila pseudoobscura pseudoobscura TaxID=46245 RepID=A0A6I8US93_DROPS|nr:protein takeout [Drosophila pseudoobscura]